MRARAQVLLMISLVAIALLAIACEERDPDVADYTTEMAAWFSDATFGDGLSLNHEYFSEHYAYTTRMVDSHVGALPDVEPPPALLLADRALRYAVLAEAAAYARSEYFGYLAGEVARSQGWVGNGTFSGGRWVTSDYIVQCIHASEDRYSESFWQVGFEYEIPSDVETSLVGHCANLDAAASVRHEVQELWAREVLTACGIAPDLHEWRSRVSVALEECSRDE